MVVRRPALTGDVEQPVLLHRQKGRLEPTAARGIVRDPEVDRHTRRVDRELMRVARLHRLGARETGHDELLTGRDAVIGREPLDEHSDFGACVWEGDLRQRVVGVAAELLESAFGRVLAHLGRRSEEGVVQPDGDLMLVLHGRERAPKLGGLSGPDKRGRSEREPGSDSRKLSH